MAALGLLGYCCPMRMHEANVLSSEVTNGSRAQRGAAKAPETEKVEPVYRSFSTL